MLSIEFWGLIFIVAGLAALLVFFGIRRYQYAINPLFIFALFDIGLLTLLSATVANSLSDGVDLGLAGVLYLTTVYLAGFLLIFIPRRFHLPRLLFDGLLSIAGKNVVSARYGRINQWILVLITLVLFILLMLSSGAGLLWLTDSRLAYQSYRAGSGFIFVMVQWAMLASLVYYIWTKKPQLSSLLWTVCLYSLAAFFTGSKANVLAGFVMAGFYYYFFIKRIPTILIMLAPFAGLGAFLTLLVLQGSYNDILSAMSYFRDYAQTTGQFLMRFNEFGLQFGYGSVSDLWFYVPRALYPDKPYEYGIVLIHKVLFPGMAAQGYTPGILPWALAYLDFGAIGVFLFGMTAGFIRRGAYESFLANRGNVLAFVLMIQLSLIPVFAYATAPLMIIIGILLALFMRRRIVVFPPARYRTNQ